MYIEIIASHAHIRILHISIISFKLKSNNSFLCVFIFFVLQTDMQPFRKSQGGQTPFYIFVFPCENSINRPRNHPLKYNRQSITTLIFTGRHWLSLVLNIGTSDRQHYLLCTALPRWATWTIFVRRKFAIDNRLKRAIKYFLYMIFTYCTYCNLIQYEKTKMCYTNT